MRATSLRDWAGALPSAGRKRERWHLAGIGGSRAQARWRKVGAVPGAAGVARRAAGQGRGGVAGRLCTGAWGACGPRRAGRAARVCASGTASDILGYPWVCASGRSWVGPGPGARSLACLRNDDVQQRGGPGRLQHCVRADRALANGRWRARGERQGASARYVPVQGDFGVVELSVGVGLGVGRVGRGRWASIGQRSAAQPALEPRRQLVAHAAVGFSCLRARPSSVPARCRAASALARPASALHPTRARPSHPPHIHHPPSAIHHPHPPHPSHPIPTAAQPYAAAVAQLRTISPRMLHCPGAQIPRESVFNRPHTVVTAALC